MGSPVSRYGAIVSADILDATISAADVSAAFEDAFGRTEGQAGMLAGSQDTTVALTASRAYVRRFVPSRDMAIVNIGFTVTTAAGSDDACDVGIYASDLQTKLVSAGATAGKLNATGRKTVAVTSTPLTAGTTYYAAFSVGTFGTTGATLAATTSGHALAATIFGATAGLTLQDFQAAAHPLAATITIAGGGIVTVPALALLES